ncbi:PucR family transcriptional regulator [Sulfobacillus thermosulfidooxidans]|uniref:PucR family transcriptional regulator n=1 Tax=Sulfobacillus thermosulfidooxidans TaxID=28034 RepID=UPI0006B5B201|nr:helix-turn-helix domain-containing protein [Sulfobacillus thermosulfidooxidans]
MSRLFDSIPASAQSTFVKEKLGALLEERTYSRELLWTLKVYLDSNGQAGEAAKRLYVHRNTLAYRLARLQELLGCDLKNLDTVTDLRLALTFYYNGIQENGGKDDVKIEKTTHIS